VVGSNVVLSNFHIAFFLRLQFVTTIRTTQTHYVRNTTSTNTSSSLPLSGERFGHALVCLVRRRLTPAFFRFDAFLS
jgi:hypothetical protein